jgi:ureidoglycolate hydrolase
MGTEYIEITSFEGEGYQPMVDFKTWRVAILKYCEELEIENIKTMQRHLETDEVFILLEGNCMLFSGGREEEVSSITAVPMKPFQLYNVKQGVWHTHTLDRRGRVLIVENQNTSDSNSPICALTDSQLQELRNQFQ